MIIVQQEFCPKNHVCPSMSKCPVGAITQDSPYSAPKIDQTKCTNCGLCTKSCNVFRLEKDKKD